ncbi:MAG: carbohydrate-binding family 9-like protein [Alistipes sp.]
MKEPLIIPRIAIDIDDRASLDRTFAAVEALPIGCNNWAEAYPYAPHVVFRMFHTGALLLLRFEVTEQYAAAAVVEDQGEVWTDSCVEFFLALDHDGYYNFETNCIGTMLLAFRRDHPSPTYASAAVMHAVQRLTSLDRAPLVEQQGVERWTLTLAIPPEALFRHAVSSWSGLRARMNLYKCGDHLLHPHFLSWQPIVTPQPDFHRPEFFTEVLFAE